VATPGRTEDSAVGSPPQDLLLYSQPYRFEFFQAVRLLQRFSPHQEPVGRRGPPSSEAVQFAAHASLACPASQIQAIEPREDRPPLMTVNFMGLTGPLGVLPLPYSEIILERLRARDTALRDFFDLFNHRIISLFYQAWEKYRFTIAYERGERDRFSRHLLDLLGLGTTGLQDRQDVIDDALLFYGGMLALHTRSAAALELLLCDYFEVPVEVEQFIGAWYPLDRQNLCSVGQDHDTSGMLGLGAVVGDQIWDQQSRVRLRLGPLTRQQYEDFLPGGAAFEPLRALAHFFAGGEFDIEAQLILRRDDVPPCELGEEAAVPRLGWTTWVKTRPLRCDPFDAVLEL